jgi:anti-sigma regulatory factor (Ser/Thr protein kinase)
MMEVGPALDFELSTLHDVRQRVSEVAARSGLSSERQAGLVLAVSELATNAIRYGGGHGRLRCWVDDHRIIAEVEDSGHGPELALAVARPARGAPSGYGLWIASQMTDRVAISASDVGTTVRVEICC